MRFYHRAVMEHNIARIILTISFLSSIQELSKATGSNYSKFRRHNNANSRAYSPRHHASNNYACNGQIRIALICQTSTMTPLDTDELKLNLDEFLQLEYIRLFTMTSVHASSMTSPSASVVPLLSSTQNSAITRGLESISQFTFTFSSPTWPVLGVHVIRGPSAKIYRLHF